MLSKTGASSLILHNKTQQRQWRGLCIVQAVLRFHGSLTTRFSKYHGFSKLKIRGMFLNTTVFWSNLIIFCDFCKICHIECEKVFQNTGFYLHGSVRVSKNCVSGGLPVYLKKKHFKCVFFCFQIIFGLHVIYGLHPFAINLGCNELILQKTN